VVVLVLAPGGREFQAHPVFVAVAETDVFSYPMWCGVRDHSWPEAPHDRPGQHYLVCAGFKREAVAVAVGWLAGYLRSASPVTGPAGTAGTRR
jgi:hypothetical protein